MLNCCRPELVCVRASINCSSYVLVLSPLGAADVGATGSGATGSGARKRAAELHERELDKLHGDDEPEWMEKRLLEPGTQADEKLRPLDFIHKNLRREIRGLHAMGGKNSARGGAGGPQSGAEGAASGANAPSVLHSGTDHRHLLRRSEFLATTKGLADNEGSGRTGARRFHTGRRGQGFFHDDEPREPEHHHGEREIGADGSEHEPTHFRSAREGWRHVARTAGVELDPEDEVDGEWESAEVGAM